MTELLFAVSQVTLLVDQSTSNLAVVTNILTKISNAPSQNQEVMHLVNILLYLEKYFQQAVMDVIGILSRIQQWPLMVVQGNGSM